LIAVQPDVNSIADFGYAVATPIRRLHTRSIPSVGWFQLRIGAGQCAGCARAAGEADAIEG
jgi:hypothetical protein